MHHVKNPDINITISAFSSLSVHSLYDMLKLRSDIFVVEQACAYTDSDGKDPGCWHLLAINESNEIVGTARIAPVGHIYTETSIGRVAVHPKYRKKNIGKKMMTTALHFCKDELKAPSVKIAAQVYLEKFYADMGFSNIGDRYLWDGIDHQNMIKLF